MRGTGITAIAPIARVQASKIRPDAEPRIWRSVRRSVREAFAAPALSPDGLSLYYHARVNGQFVVFRVTRDPHAGEVHANGCAQPTRTPSPPARRPAPPS